MQIDLKSLIGKSGKTKTISVSSIDGYEPFDILLTNKEGKRIELVGDTICHSIFQCDRCLSDVSCDVFLSIDKSYRIEDELIYDEDYDVNVPLAEGILDLDTLLCKEFQLEKPTKVLCKDDCKGLCPNCGQNLNIRDCGCNRDSLDPRMAKVLDIFSEFKEVNGDVDLSEE